MELVVSSFYLEPHKARVRSEGLAINSVQELEQDSTITDALYVGAASAADLRSAFRNFFKDAKEFCKKIHTAQNGLKPLLVCMI